MTAPEPTRPADEHTDAVALMLADLDHYRRGNTLPAGTLGAVYRERAVRVLTSTDPAVHAAMLDALVRAGVLTEDRERLVRACGCIANEEPAACCDPLASPHWERRYVTRWVAL